MQKKQEGTAMSDPKEMPPKEMLNETKKIQIYGIMVEFDEPEPLIQAAHVAYAAGFRSMDAYTPFPVEELDEALGFKKERVALITLLGGLSGGTVAFVMQWYSNVISYPINVGGRPFFSWQAFIPVTFELTVLGAALSAVFGMLFLNRLPKLWHPTFNSNRFYRASLDRFFLCIQAKDPLFPLFNIEKIHSLFFHLNPLSLEEVKLDEE
jgi:hypothetical protein